ncbi:MAG: hypothetical protein P8L82_07720 [Paracoccaceae bacterium]|nr:hypothetical protein [Paracoccaceae bacterium]
MILINIAVLMTLVGLGVFSYGITKNSISNQDETILISEKVSESTATKGKKEVRIISYPTDGSLTKTDEFSEIIKDLEDKISLKKNNLYNLTNEVQELNSKKESLGTENENLRKELSEFKSEIANVQKVREEKLAVTKELTELRLQYGSAIELTQLLQENEDLKSTLETQDIKIKNLEQEISENKRTQTSDDFKSMEEMDTRLEKLEVEKKKLQKELETNKDSQLTSDKLFIDQKNQILKIRAENLELKEQLATIKTDEVVLSMYNGIIATFEGNLVYELNKKKIILVTPEGIEFTIIQDDFPGDLVAKCGLPVSSSSKDRCFATISAQMLLEDNQLMLKGKEIKKITKK